MKIDHLRSTLGNLGLTGDQIDQLSALAADLPESNIAAQIPGLSETESATLVSHLLHRLAPNVGVVFEHPDVLRELEFPLHEPTSRRTERAAEATDANHYANGNAA